MNEQKNLTLGKFLQEKLSENNITLKELHVKTKISNRYLKIIFYDDYENYPPEVYLKGYLKEIAKFLKINFSEIEKFLSNIPVKKINKITPKYEPILSIEKNKSFIRLIFVLIFIVILGVIVFFSFKKEKKVKLSKISNRNKQIHKPLKKLPIKPKKSQPKMIIDNISKKDNNTNEIKEVKKINPKNALKTLEIFGEELTWIRITIDNKTKKTLYIKKGDNVTLQATKNFKLDIGNAGGIKIYFNGKNLGSPGKKGEVKHIILK